MPRGDTVWIVGMMGVGKSTVARLVAQRLGRPFVDTDAWVEGKTRRSIADIFARDGEAVFRDLEREAIETVAGQPVVAALGGGAIAQPGAAERLEAGGVVVALRAEAPTLLERIGDPESRPLLAGLDPDARLERIGRLLDEREPHYARAHLHVDTDGLAADEVAERVLRALAQGETAA